jgi:hypothetical protein
MVICLRRGTAVLVFLVQRRTERATISVFGNIDYDFDGKYYSIIIW